MTKPSAPIPEAASTPEPSGFRVIAYATAAIVPSMIPMTI